MNNLINLFLTYGKAHIYKENEIVFNEQDYCDVVGYISKGKMKISTFSNNENEVVINLLSKKDIFGDLLVFSNSPYYYGMGIALESTVIYFLKKNELLKLLNSDISYLEEFLSLVTNKGVMLKQTNKLLAHKNIEERLLYYLNHVAPRNSDATVYYKSITDLANILSISRPSLSRVIHKMVRENKVKLEKHKIKL